VTVHGAEAAGGGDAPVGDADEDGDGSAAALALGIVGTVLGAAGVALGLLVYRRSSRA
jgi:hypothetical protein